MVTNDHPELARRRRQLQLRPQRPGPHPGRLTAFTHGRSNLLETSLTAARSRRSSPTSTTSSSWTTSNSPTSPTSAPASAHRRPASSAILAALGVSVCPPHDRAARSGSQSKHASATSRPIAAFSPLVPRFELWSDAADRPHASAHVLHRRRRPPSLRKRLEHSPHPRRHAPLRHRHPQTDTAHDLPQETSPEPRPSLLQRLLPRPGDRRAHPLPRPASIAASRSSLLVVRPGRTYRSSSPPPANAPAAAHQHRSLQWHALRPRLHARARRSNANCPWNIPAALPRSSPIPRFRSATQPS